MAANTGSRILNKIAGQTVTPKGNKSTTRVLDPLDSFVTLEDGTVVTVKEAVNSFVRYDLQEKSAKDQKEEFSSVLRDYAGKLRDEYAVNGDYQKTFRVLGGKSKELQMSADVSQADKFSVPKEEEDIQALKTILGEKFGDYLERDVTISIRPEVLKNKGLRTELSKRLAEAFGEELKNYFVKDEIWTTKEGIDQLQYTLEEKNREEMRTKLVPAKDAVKNTSYVEK
jgi:hypothetical protein